MCTLWQRFGQGARNPALTAIALFLVEPGYFDDIRELKTARKAARAEKAKQKAVDGRKRKKQKLVHAIATPIIDIHEAAYGCLELPSTDENVPTASHPVPNSSMERALPSPNPRALHAQPASVIKDSVAYKSNESDSDDDNDDNADAEQAMWEQERLTLYHKSDPTASKGVCKAKEQRNIDPAVDDMINANAAGQRFKCFRAPVNLFFENNTNGASVISQHQMCMF